MVANERFKTKEKSSWVIPKVVAVAFEIFTLQSLSHSSNGVSQSSLTRASGRRASTVFTKLTSQEENNKK